MSFDPKPLRAGVIIAVLFIAGPGSGYGAAFLWTLGGGTSPLALVPPSTHAMLQLAGGFMSLIWTFLGIGVAHLLGLDGGRARFILAPLAVVAVSLLVDVAAALTLTPLLGTAARVAGAVATLAGLALFVWARRERRPLPVPLPFLVAALALQPLAWVLYALESVGRAPAGVGGELLLLAVVVPIVMSMGYQMFAGMLQLERDPRLFVAALLAWMAGALVVVGARVWPALLVVGTPLLFVGAALWLASMNGLRRRARDIIPAHELRVNVVVAAACLLMGPLLWLYAAVARAPVADLARHVIAIGFVLVITMGVTLRALPRFCRGRPSSPALGVATLALLLVGLALRFARLLDDGGALVRASALVSLVAILVWSAHLVRGLREARPG